MTMKVVLLDIDKFVQANQLKEVSSAIILERGYTPHPDGLLSTEIFGTSTKSRKETFAYIDLKCHLFQPIVYKTLLRLDRRIESIVAGTNTYSVKDGQIVEDPKGETGIEWLYRNWDKIKWKRNNSRIRSERISFLEAYKKAEIFQSKEIVCPAFYRDINLRSSKAGRPAIHEFNRPYSKLIRLASVLDQGDFAFNLNYTRYMMQNTLVDIYDMFKRRIEKKRGLIKQGILGKSTDWAARVVISNANFSYNSIDEMQVDFYHLGTPLAYCISLFTPFFSGWIQNYMRLEFEQLEMKFPHYDPKTKKFQFYKVVDPMVQFSDDKVKDLMNKYIYSYEDRFNPIMVRLINEKGKEIEAPMVFKGNMTRPLTSFINIDIDPENMELKTQNVEDIKSLEELANQRPMTLTDLMYIAAADICKDKHIYVTRYPMSDYLGIFPIGISILTTTETEKMVIDGVEYRHYPKVEYGIPKEDVPKKFQNVVQMSNTYLEATGGRQNCPQSSLIAGNSRKRQSAAKPERERSTTIRKE
jgi:hypothetical protein